MESWQDARELTQGIFALSSTKSPKERHGALWEQLTRAALSVMAHIAEGFGRPSDAGFARFLGIAQGSILEVHSHPYIALDLGYLTQDQFEGLYRQSCLVSRKIGGLIPYLRRHRRPQRLGLSTDRPSTGDHGPAPDYRP